MARIGVSIEKDVSFQGKAERISNTYHYEHGAAMTDADIRDLVAELVTDEKQVHSGDVSYKLARVWSAGGTPAQNDQLALIDLAGTGSMAAPVQMAAELAVLVEWECAREDLRGRKVYLRKFIRSQGLGTNDLGATLQRFALPAAELARFNTYADAVESYTTAPTGTLFALVSETGRAPIGVGVGRADPFVRNRNIRK